MADLVEEHIEPEAVLHWREDGIVVDNGAGEDGQLDVSGDQNGGGMNRVEIS